MAMSSGIMPFVASAATVIAGYFGNRGLKMRDQGRYLAEWLSYTFALSVLASAALLWFSTEPGMIPQQRIVLGAIGALLGMCAMISLGEWIRPFKAAAQSSEASSTIESDKPISNGPVNIYGNNHVFSLGQKGGITAGSVNVGPVPRSLNNLQTADLKKQIVNELPKDKPIVVMAVLGDSEAISFAAEIHQFLKANDFPLKEDGISQGVFTGPVKGLTVRDDGSVRTFIVGANLP